MKLSQTNGPLFHFFKDDLRSTLVTLKNAGFNVHLLSDCLAYVDKDGHAQALKDMAQDGIRIE